MPRNNALVCGPRAARLAAGLPLDVVAKRAGLAPDTLRGIEAQYIRLARMPRLERDLLFRARRRCGLPPLLPGEFTCRKIGAALKCPAFPRGLPIEHFHQFPALVAGESEPGMLHSSRGASRSAAPAPPFDCEVSHV